MAIAGSSLVSVWGDIIRIVEKDVLDSFVNSWNSISGVASESYYKYYALDESDPLAFWIYPLPVANANIILTYAKNPTALTATSDTIELSDEYIDALVDYVVYRALSKESRADTRAVADKYLASFQAKLGVSRQILRTSGQNANRPPNAGA